MKNGSEKIFCAEFLKMLKIVFMFTVTAESTPSNHRFKRPSLFRPLSAG